MTTGMDLPIRNGVSLHFGGHAWQGTIILGLLSTRVLPASRNAWAQKQMGPAFLPTPLLPARGLPEKDLAADVPRLVRTISEDVGVHWRYHRCSRRHPVPSSSSSDPKIFAFPFRFRDRPILNGQVSQAVLHLPKLLQSHRHLTELIGP